MTINDKWIKDNSGLIWKCVNKYKHGEKDLFQIACMAAIEKAPLFDDTLGVKFETYIYYYMDKAIKYELRKWRLPIRGGSVQHVELDERHVRTSYTIEDDMINNVFICNLIESAKLTRVQREVLEMRVYDQMKFQEIGNERGTSKRAAQESYASAINKIKRVISSWEVEND